MTLKQPKKTYKHDRRNDSGFKHGTVPANLAVKRQGVLNIASRN